MEKPESEMTTKELWKKYLALGARAQEVKDDPSTFNKIRQQADSIAPLLMEREKP